MQQLHLVIPQFSFDMPFRKPNSYVKAVEPLSQSSWTASMFSVVPRLPWSRGVTSDPLHVNKTA